MRLHRHLYRIVAPFVIIAFFVGLVLTLWAPKTAYAVSRYTHLHSISPSKASMPQNDNGLLGWPFSTSEASWRIYQGYNAKLSPDHNCLGKNIVYHCYQRYGFDFVTSNNQAGGKTVL